MKSIRIALGALIALSLFSVGWTDENPPVGQSPTGAVTETVEQARRQAELLHETLHSTLQIVHHRYYREDEGLILPAAALKDVFAELEQKQNIELRWLVVEGQAMNTDHKPQNDFEHAAVKALSSGKPAYEQAVDGTYRRAGSITLSNQCLKCHVPDRRNTADRHAGLIIAIPLGAK